MVAEEETPAQPQFPQEHAHTHRPARKRRRINTVMQSVPIGDAGVRIGDGPAFRFHGSTAHSRPDAAADTPTEARGNGLSAPFLTMVVLAIPHALVMFAIEALTRTAAWRDSREGLVAFAVCIAFLLVAPGAIGAWFARGKNLEFGRWFKLAGTEWLFLAVTSGIVWASNLPRLIDPATVVYFGIPILAALALIITLAMTEPGKRA